MAGPLSHIKVLDLSRVLAGPWAGQNLADLGAEVIKVEEPGRGDYARRTPPFWGQSDVGAYFLLLNRNKKSVSIDLKAEAGKEVFRRLVRTADVVAALCAGTRVDRGSRGREYVLPAPLQMGTGIFARQGVWQFDASDAPLDGVLVQELHVLEVHLEFVGHRFREDGDAILHALAVTHHDAAVVEVDVLHSQAQRFEQSQSAAVQQPGDEPVGAGHLGDHLAGFLAGEHGRQALRAVRAHDIVDPGQVDIQHAFVEKEQGGEGLRLGGGRDLAGVGEVAQEIPDLVAAHVARVAAGVEEDEAADPVDISLFGAVAVVAEADGGADGVQEAGWSGHGDRWTGVDRLGVTW